MRWRMTINAVLALYSASLIGALRAEGNRRWTLYGLRPLGMGNAFVSVVDDYNALYYNPAGLARIKAWDGEFFNPYFEGSKGIKTLIDDTSSMGNSDPNKIIDLINKNTGESFHFGLGIIPHLIFPKFGLAIGIEALSTTAVFHRDISVELNTGANVIAPIAFGLNFLDDRLSVGFGTKFRGRAGIDREFSIDDISALSTKNNDNTPTNINLLQESGNTADTKKISDYLLSGYGVGVDLGILFTPTPTMAPTLGISITDLGGTSYTATKVNGESGGPPPLILPSVNVGFSMKPISSNKLSLITAVDMHSINQPFSFSKKFSAGAELGYGSIIKIQTGLYHGYLTGGLLFDVGLINFKLITYSEELGDNAGFKEDRRISLQFKLLL